MQSEPDTRLALAPLVHSQRQQDWLLWAAVGGTLAAIAGVLLLAVTPDALAIDYVLQISLAVVYAACAARLLFVPDVNPAPIASAIGYFTTATFAARFVSGLIFARNAQAMELTLLPYSGWWALVVLVNCTFLGPRTALRLNLGYAAVLNGSLLLWVSNNFSAFVGSFQLLCLAVLLITGLPLFILIMHGFVTLHRDQLEGRLALQAKLAKLESRATTAPGTASLETLLGTASRSAQQPHGDQRWLIALSITNPVEGLPPSALARCLAPDAVAIADIDANQATWYGRWPEAELRERMRQIQHHARVLGRNVSIGAAAYREGETASAWLERAQFAAFAARDETGDSVLVDA